jgi:chemotaxis protein methyltransferase CheR
MLHTDYALPADLLEQFAKKVEAETGLSFAGSKRRDLRLATHRMAESIGAQNDAECLDWLLSGPWDASKADLCAHHLTIGETYFFREPRAFDLVSDYAREKIEAFGMQNTRLRIWSAGCCTGEEAYSIAMALRQFVPQLPARQISILGTDINHRHLQFARTGVYRQWSFRNFDAALQKSNFAAAGEGQFQLNKEIREMVQFSALNLAAPVYPSIAMGTYAMDIIFCRNVLMYFSRDQAMNVIQRFHQCLMDGGWLIVSPSEASAELFSGFEGVYYPDAIFFKKAGPRATSTDAGHGLPGMGPSANSDAGYMLPKQVAGSDRTTGLEAFSGVKQLQPARRKAGKSKADGRISGSIGPAMDDAPAAPTDESYHAKALLAMESGDHRDALQNLKRVLYLQPDSIIAHYLMGAALSAQGKQHAADKQFEITHRLLAFFKDEDLVPESDGLSAGFLRASVQAFLQKGNK